VILRISSIDGPKPELSAGLIGMTIFIYDTTTQQVVALHFEIAETDAQDSTLLMEGICTAYNVAYTPNDFACV